MRVGREIRSRVERTVSIVAIGMLAVTGQVAAQSTPLLWTASVRLQGTGYANEGIGIDVSRRMFASRNADVSLSIGLTPGFTTGDVCGQLPEVAEEFSVLASRTILNEEHGLRIVVGAGAFAARTTFADCAYAVSTAPGGDEFTRLDDRVPHGALVSAGLRWVAPGLGRRLSISLALREYVGWVPRNLIRPVLAIGLSW